MTVTGGFLSVDFVIKKQKTSSIDGSVDSSDDEKRSQLRYILRIANALSSEILNAQRRWIYPSAHLVQGLFVLTKCVCLLSRGASFCYLLLPECAQ